MNRLSAVCFAAAFAVALAGCSGGSNAYGGIQAINATNHTVTLYTGSTFTFDAATDLSKWKVGDVVHVTYNIDSATKKNMATSIGTYP